MPEMLIVLNIKKLKTNPKMNKNELLELFGLKSEDELKDLYNISKEFTPEELAKLVIAIPENKGLILMSI